MSNNTLSAVDRLKETQWVNVSKTGVCKPISRKAYLASQLEKNPNATKKELKAQYRDIQANYFRAAGMSVGAVLGDPNCVVTSFRVKTNDEGVRTGYSATWKIANAEESGSVAKKENSDLRKQNEELKKMIEELKASKQS
jgi:hypothetical protein